MSVTSTPDTTAMMHVEESAEFQFRNPLRPGVKGESEPMTPGTVATFTATGVEVRSKAESKALYRRKNTLYETQQSPWFSRPLHLAVEAGVEDKDDYEVRRNKRIVLTFILPSTFFLWLWLGYTMVNYNSQFPHVLDPFIIFGVAASLSFGVVYYLRKKNHKPLRDMAVVFALCYPAAFWLSHGCIDLPVSAHLWGFCAPIGLLLTGGSSTHSMYTLCASLLLTILRITVDTFDLAHCPDEWASSIIDDDHRVSWFFLRLILDIVPLCLIYAALQEFRKRMTQEKILSNKLLRNVLPADIGDVLEEKLRSEELWKELHQCKNISPSSADLVIADHHTNVSVLFADIVGFTAYSRTVSPHQLLKQLNAIVEQLDDTCLALDNVVKIKTIGDCYMCAGFPIAMDHASVQSAAFNTMQVGVKACQLGGSELTNGLEFRVGLNTGSIVAGVIGADKFIYDLWGDTVNVASRLESHGIPSHIQVTEPVYELLKDRFAFSFRGRVQLKGVGEVITWIWCPDNENTTANGTTLVSRVDSVNAAVTEVETVTLPSSKASTGETIGGHQQQQQSAPSGSVLNELSLRQVSSSSTVQNSNYNNNYHPHSSSNCMATPDKSLSHQPPPLGGSPYANKTDSGSMRLTSPSTMGGSSPPVTHQLPGGGGTHHHPPKRIQIVAPADQPLTATSRVNGNPTQPQPATNPFAVLNSPDNVPLENSNAKPLKLHGVDKRAAAQLSLGGKDDGALTGITDYFEEETGLPSSTSHNTNRSNIEEGGKAGGTCNNSYNSNSSNRNDSRSRPGTQGDFDFLPSPPGVLPH